MMVAVVVFPVGELLKLPARRVSEAASRDTVDITDVATTAAVGVSATAGVSEMCSMEGDVCS